MKIEEEQRLIERAKVDVEAFAQLYDHYVDRVYAYIFRQTRDHAETQDVVAAAFEKALRQISGYRWQGVRFGAWLFKIARHELGQRRRRSWRWLPLVDRLISPVRVEAAVADQFEHEALGVALMGLRPADREMIRLFYFEGLTHREIGLILSISENTSAVRLKRALNRLRKNFCHERERII
ncbi:MAG: sigma-70 family RNA polymerase sigma factor [Ardenticatenaceae bacterium]|nr:sigma-70 family RNA polymerase sigma factor [Ardenticatenaceae bacterium]